MYKMVYIMESLPTEMFHIVGAYFDIHEFLGICKIYNVKPLYNNYFGMNETKTSIEIVCKIDRSIVEKNKEYMNLIEYLDNQQPNNRVNDDVLWQAYNNGHLEIVKYLESVGYVHPDEKLDNSFIYDYPDIIIHLFVINKLPDLDELLDIAVCNCFTNTDTLEFLRKLGATYTDYAMKYAAKCGNFVTVKYLFSIGAKCTTESLLMAIDDRFDYWPDEIVKFMYCNGAIITYDIIIKLCRNGFLDSLMYLYNQNEQHIIDLIKNNEDDNDKLIDNAINNDHLYVVEFLIKIGSKPPGQPSFELACGNKWPDIVEYLYSLGLEKYNIKFEQDIMNIPANNNNCRMIKYLFSIGMPYESFVITQVIKNGDLQLFKLLIDADYERNGKYEDYSPYTYRFALKHANQPHMYNYILSKVEDNNESDSDSSISDISDYKTKLIFFFT